MGVVAPILDNRSYQQLRDELVGRIPTYTPEWTDHNESDPGIALLELFAFLAESLLFRFNQIPDHTKVAFLDLLNLKPRPAEPAIAMVVAATEDAAGVQILKGNELKAGAVPFETENEVYVWPLEVAGLGKVKLSDAEAATPESVLDRLDIAQRLGIVDPDSIVLYNVSTLADDPAAPEAVALDVGDAVDESLWIALLRKDTTDLALLRGRAIFIGIEMDGAVAGGGPFDLQQLGVDRADEFRCHGQDTGAPAMQWELWKRKPTPNGPPAFAPLEVSGDTTRGFTQSGVVAVTLPHDFEGLAPSVLNSGGNESPPPLEDPNRANRIVAWLRVKRPVQENDKIHRVRWIGVNVVEVVQASTAALEFVGVGNGDTDQRFRLAHPNVLPRTIELEVEELGGWRAWKEVDSFVGSERDDRQFTVDRASGEVAFGGLGHHPQIGERIRARTYRYGGGIAGRVPAKAITRATGFGNVKLSNPLPARGGTDREPLDQALERIPEELFRRDRAVTEDDFRSLSMEVPGVERAEVLGRFHPDVPFEVAAGVVTVVIFPKEDRRDPAAPMPDQPLLRDVCRYLDPRRLITTELYVIPPTYYPIAVSVGVHVRGGYQVDAVRRWVELILRQFLAPVPSGGPEGNGWPLGRAIRRQELEAVAVQVEGVEYLEGMLMAEMAADGSWGPPVNLVPLEKWEVPRLTSITVVEGGPLEPGGPFDPPEPGQPPLAPVPKDIC